MSRRLPAQAPSPRRCTATERISRQAAEEEAQQDPWAQLEQQALAARLVLLDPRGQPGQQARRVQVEVLEQQEQLEQPGRMAVLEQ